MNAVNPGTVDSPWIGRLLGAADPVAERAALEARQPHGRLVTADEVAAAIVYLASPAVGSSPARRSPSTAGWTGCDSAARGDVMQRFASVIRLRPEKTAEYLGPACGCRGRACLRPLRRAHVSNYSIFLRDGLLFSYLEYTGTNYEADMASVAADPETQRWWLLTDPCQQPVDTAAAGRAVGASRQRCSTLTDPTCPADRIDAHYHLWRLSVRDQPWTAELPGLRRDFTLDELRPQLIEAGYTAGVLVQTGSRRGRDTRDADGAPIPLTRSRASSVGSSFATPDVADRLAALTERHRRAALAGRYPARGPGRARPGLADAAGGAARADRGRGLRPCLRPARPQSIRCPSCRDASHGGCPGSGSSSITAGSRPSPPACSIRGENT